MTKYVFTYHGGGMPESPEQQEQVMAAWGAWFEQLGDAVVDGGNPFGESRTVTADGSVNAGGGANAATGYSAINAPDIETAVQHAKGCPILTDGGSVEVSEAIEM